MPLVSIILPSYQRAGTVRLAVDSVLGQTEEDWELLVVDDASDDGTEAVVRACGDDRIRYVRRDVNGGVAAAQNTGLDHARGTFVSFLHSDDRLLPGALAHHLGVLVHDHTAAASEGAVESIGDDGGTMVPPSLRDAAADDLLAFLIGVHIGGFMFRTDVMGTLRFDPALRSYEDWDLLLRLLRAGHEVATFDDTVAAIDRRGTDRISGSAAEIGALEHLLARYADDLARAPHIRSRWHLKLARYQRAQGRHRAAQRHLVAAVRDDPARARLLVLAAAGLCGGQAMEWTWRRYEQLARAKLRAS